MSPAAWQAAKYFRSASLAADEVRYIDREKIGAIEKPIDGFELDMIRVNVPAMLPLRGCDRSLRCRGHAARFRADKRVLAIGLVPDWDDLDPQFASFFKCA